MLAREVGKGSWLDSQARDEEDKEETNRSVRSKGTPVEDRILKLNGNSEKKAENTKTLRAWFK